MKLSAIPSLFLLISTHLAAAASLPRSEICGIDTCLCGNSCRALEEGENCCPQKGEHKEHICSPNKECCGYGCCREGWSCGENDMCYPPLTASSARTRCITTVLTIIRPIPIYPTQDETISGTLTRTNTCTSTYPSTNSGVISSKVTKPTESSNLISTIEFTTTSGRIIPTDTASMRSDSFTGSSGLSSSQSRPSSKDGDYTPSTNGDGQSSTAHSSSILNTFVTTATQGSISSSPGISNSQNPSSSWSTGTGATEPVTDSVTTNTSGSLSETISSVSDHTQSSQSSTTVTRLTITNSDGSLSTTTLGNSSGSLSSGMLSTSSTVTENVSESDGSTVVTSNSLSITSRGQSETTTASITTIEITNSNGQTTTTVSTVQEPSQSPTSSVGSSAGSTVASTGTNTNTPIVTTNSDGVISTITPTRSITASQNTSSKLGSITTSSGSDWLTTTSDVDTSAGENTSRPTASTDSELPTSVSSGTGASTETGPSSGTDTSIGTETSVGTGTSTKTGASTDTGTSAGTESTNPTEITSTNASISNTVTGTGSETKSSNVPTDSADSGTQSTVSASETSIGSTATGSVTSTGVDTGVSTSSEYSSISNTESTGTETSSDTPPNVTTLSDGQVTTLPDSTNTGSGTSTNTGPSVPSNTEASRTDLTTSPSPGVTTLSNGQVTTLPTSTDSEPSTPTESTPSNSNGSNTGSSTGNPSSMTASSDNQITTSTTSERGQSTTETAKTTQTSSEEEVIIPVTTTVTGPQPTDHGYKIPCNMWFFLTCINWKDWDLFGWEVIHPPGIVPPGPPPPIRNLPSATVTVRIVGPTPKWPEYTIGPDNQPTFPPEPEDCETETAEMYMTSTSYGVSVSDSITTTTGTEVLTTSFPIYGCHVEDDATTTAVTSTSTATAEPTMHVVYPMDGADQSKVDTIDATLNDLVNDSSDIYKSKKDPFGVLFWRLPITTAQADELTKLSEVASVLEDCDNDRIPCYDPTIEMVYQEDAVPQLNYISWPQTDPLLPLSDLENRYYFDNSSGDGIDVWLIDSGLTISHPEFDLIRDKTQWLTPLSDYNGQTPQDDSQPKGHGTAMLSLVAGKTIGVAKNIKPHIVRLPRKSASDGSWSREDFLETMAEAANSMQAASGSETAGIVLMAVFYPRSSMFRIRGDQGTSSLQADDLRFDESYGFARTLHVIIQSIVSKGYLVVTGTGNAAPQKVDGWPANFGATADEFYKPSVLVAGALAAGEPSSADRPYGSVDTEKGLPHVYAPGKATKVAQGNSDGGLYRESKGTSDAAALTAGLAAYLLRLIQLGQVVDRRGGMITNSPEALKEFIISIAWSRGPVSIPRAQDGGLSFTEGDAIGIFNGVDLDGIACKWNPDSPSSVDEDTCEIPLSPTSSAFSTTEVPTESTELPTSTEIETTTTEPETTEEPTETTETETWTGLPTDLPTLTGIYTPTTTSEEESSTEVETSTKQSWPTVTITPLELGEIECNDEKDFPGHADVNRGALDAIVERYCFINAAAEPYYPDKSTQQTIPDWNSVYMGLKIAWTLGCVTTVDEQHRAYPLGDDGPDCKEIIMSLYDDCTGNGGVGGAVDAGCLRIRLDAGVGKNWDFPRW